MNKMTGAGYFLAVLSATALSHAQNIACFEAESATNITPLLQVGGPSLTVTNTAWFAVPGASGDRYLEIPQAPMASPEQVATQDEAKVKMPGSAALSFSVSKEGTYTLWCRAWWLDSCGNSVYISIDGAKPFSFGQNGTYTNWHWVKSPAGMKQLTLKEGAHSLAFSAREDGIRLDQVLLTIDSRYVPVGIEDVTVKPDK